MNEEEEEIRYVEISPGVWQDPLTAWERMKRLGLWDKQPEKMTFWQFIKKLFRIKK